MLGFWFMHDYEQNLALEYTKTCLVCDLCLLGFGLNVYRVFHVLGVWFIFVKKKIMFLCILVLICFWFNCLFCFSFELNHGFRFGSRLNQYFRVNLIGFVWVGYAKTLFGWLLFFYWGIVGPMGYLINTSLSLFWQFCFE